MRDGPGFELKILRLKAGRTQRSLALQVGIAPSVLSDFECGYRDLPPELLTRLRRVLQPRTEDDPAVEVSPWAAR